MRLFPVLILAVLCGGLCAAGVSVQQQDALPSQEENNSADKNNIASEQETPGQKIYERYCSTCHRDGLIGAPKFRNEQDWKSHLEGKTIDNLVTIVLKGFNAMPMKGTCYECNEEDLKSAIEYMVPQS